MIFQDKRRVIWVDDDTRMSSLILLRGLLEKRGLILETFGDLATARIFIEDLRKARENLRELSLLVDVILPKDPSGRATSPYIGFELAELACTEAFAGVAFLTVIHDREMQDRFGRLKARYPIVPIEKFDKLRLLEDSSIDDIAAFLRNPKKKEED